MRIAVEEYITGDIPISGNKFIYLRQSSVYAGCHFCGADSNPLLSIGEGGDADMMDSFAGESRRESSWRLTMAYHYVKAMPFVEFFHHLTEEAAMS